MNDIVLMSVIEPGLLTTVQDLGRFGQARFGVAPGGVLDRRAHLLGNRLLGNELGAASLEITLVGPRLGFSGETIIALTGADLGARLNGESFQLWSPVAVYSGDELSFDPAAAGTGARAYLCVAGGIDLEPVMGSRSTDLIGLFGGWRGRALHVGDALPFGRSILTADAILRRRFAVFPHAPSVDITARAVVGPQEDRFTAAGYATLFGCAFDVTGKSNRQGIRLSGPMIEHSRGADMVSEGIAHGAIQVPGDGQPIVLLAGRQTVGGYVKIATVIGADLDQFAQLRPGSHVRFAELSPDEARAATATYQAILDATDIVDSSRIVSMAGSIESRKRPLESEIKRLAQQWSPDGVIRVIEAWEKSSAATFRIEVAEFGLKLELHRNTHLDVNQVSTDAAARPDDIASATEIEVKAPVLGVFYRRSSPDQPELAEVGSVVTAGQVLCVLEVMKTYHEVTTPETGLLEAFAVEDGDFVEYGQVIARVQRRS